MHDMIIIAGPCSVESQDQLESIAEGIQELPVNYFRGGIWKPRTRPGTYEGVGAQGLTWLANIREKYNLRIITEVATTAQVEQTLNAGFDAVWLGARTTVNPFYVQEIANALKGIEIPVFVKNPINPDLSLWIGAIERIQGAIKGEVAAIHRGFSLYRKYKYRNHPHWTIPIALKEEFPQIRLLCDPSHISGDREMVPEIAQQALDLQFDGLMIETHPDPPNARSDQDQQLTPGELLQLFDRLIIRHKHVGKGLTSKKISDLRFSIDDLDEKLIHLLAQRMELSSKIGDIKAEESLSILQPDRWRWILDRAKNMGYDLHLSEEFITAFFSVIHEESINRQVDVMKRQKSL